MITYIIITIVLILLVLGVTLRKNLVVWFRSEANEIVEKHTDHIKVAKLKIKDWKANLEKLVDSAAEVYAKENSQRTQLSKFKDDYEKCMKKAKTFKVENKEDDAKIELTKALTFEKSIKLIEGNLDVLTKTREKLEIRVNKIKAHIATKEIELLGIDSRNSVNKVFKSISGNDIRGSLDVNLDLAEE